MSTQLNSGEADRQRPRRSIGGARFSTARPGRIRSPWGHSLGSEHAIWAHRRWREPVPGIVLGARKPVPKNGTGNLFGSWDLRTRARTGYRRKAGDLRSNGASVTLQVLPQRILAVLAVRWPSGWRRRFA